MSVLAETEAFFFSKNKNISQRVCFNTQYFKYLIFFFILVTIHNSNLKCIFFIEVTLLIKNLNFFKIFFCFIFVYFIISISFLKNKTDLLI